MKDSFTHDQTTVLVTSLIDMISIKNEEIELNEAYTTSLYSVIDQLNDEIVSLKAKMKAKTPKASKASKAPKSSIISKAEAQKISSAIGKRGPGRPKKMVK